MIDFVNLEKKIVYFGSKFTIYEGIERIEKLINNLNEDEYFRFTNYLIRKDAISFYFPTTFLVQNEEGNLENSFNKMKMMLVFFTSKMDNHPFIVVDDRANLQDFVEEIKKDSNLGGGDRYFITKTGILLSYDNLIYLKNEGGLMKIVTTSGKFNDMMYLIGNGEIANKECLNLENFDGFQHEDFMEIDEMKINRNYLRFLEKEDEKYSLVMGDGDYDFWEEVSSHVNLSEIGTLEKVENREYILERASNILDNNLYVYGYDYFRTDKRPLNYDSLLNRYEVNSVIFEDNKNYLVGKNFRVEVEDYRDFIGDNFVILDELAYNPKVLEEVVGVYKMKNDERWLHEVSLKFETGEKLGFGAGLLEKLDLSNFDGKLMNVDANFEMIDQELEKDKEYNIYFSAARQDSLLKTLEFPKYLENYDIFINSLLNIDNMSLYESNL